MNDAIPIIMSAVAAILGVGAFLYAGQSGSLGPSKAELLRRIFDLERERADDQILINDLQKQITQLAVQIDELKDQVKALKDENYRLLTRLSQM